MAAAVLAHTYTINSLLRLWLPNSPILYFELNII
jgi:hypothetical protein